MLQVIKFVINTKEWGLKFNPMFNNNGEWSLTMYTNSDYAGNKETRISVTGYILFLWVSPSFGNRSLNEA